MLVSRRKGLPVASHRARRVKGRQIQRVRCETKPMATLSALPVVKVQGMSAGVKREELRGRIRSAIDAESISHIPQRLIKSETD